MSRYIPLTPAEIKDMMRELGISSLEELFSVVPEKAKFKEALGLPKPKTEQELLKYFKSIAKQNTFFGKKIFLGAGSYNHYIPYVVDYLSLRSEFLTPYTPYQAEVSQGTLQATFEFQTYMAELTGLEVANASMYEGATATAEAALMALRINRRKKILLAKNLHPEYRSVVYTYLKNLEFEIQEVAYNNEGRLDLKDLQSKLDDQTSALIIGYPNFFGIIEDGKSIFEVLSGTKTLLITATWEPLSLVLIKPPGAFGAEIAVGEAQSFGIPLSYGGPYVGFMATLQRHTMKMPGRLVGITFDVEGKRGSVLTLSAREQHIRRERATSNICSNEAWCAIRVAIYLSTLGKKGLRKLAELNHKRSVYASKLLEKAGFKLKFQAPFFNEFVVEVGKEASEFRKKLLEKGFVAGYPLGKDYEELSDCLLLTFTEMNSKEDIEALVKAMEEIK